MTIEVEIRGPLKKEGFDRLRRIMEKEGEFVREKNRLSLLYFRNKITENMEDVREELVDLRVKVTNKRGGIVMKYGRWGGSCTRKEISLSFDISKFEDTLEILKHLGWFICVALSVNAKVYFFKGVEFTIAKINDLGYNYEAEIEIDNEEETEKTKEKIRKVCKELNLREYKKGEYEEQCNKINNNKENQFNFREQEISLVRKKFSGFF